MKQKSKSIMKCIMTFVLTVAVVLGAVPLPQFMMVARAVTEQYSSLIPTANDDTASLEAKVVKFNGIDWYIIADNSTAADAGTVTLFVKDPIGKSIFANSSNAYNGSSLQNFLKNLTTSGAFADVADAIVGVNINDAGNAFVAKLWPLSGTEAFNLPVEVRKCSTTYGSYWWLRTKAAFDEIEGKKYALNVNGENGGNFSSADSAGSSPVYKEYGVRPALTLDLSKVNFLSDSKTFRLKTAGYNVTITPGSNMTKTEASGAASQTGLSGAMTSVVYTANGGYYFPTNYSVAAVNGISVTRNSYTQITVSGTPTVDAAITLTAPTAKTTPDAPTAAATDCTTADNNDGKLTGVTAEMEYKKSDATEWTAGTGNDITGLVPGTYYVRVKATDTSLASDNQQLTIKAFVQKETATVTKAPIAKTLTYNGSAQELVNAGEATGGTMQYALGTKDAATGTYSASIPTATDTGTYYVWYKVKGDETHNDTEPQYVIVTIDYGSSYVAAKEPTETEAGNKAYYIRNDGKWFWDALWLAEITDHSEVIIPATGKKNDNQGSGSSSPSGDKSSSKTSNRSSGNSDSNSDSGNAVAEQVIYPDAGGKSTSINAQAPATIPAAASAGNWDRSGENWTYRFADGSYAENTWAQLSYLGRTDWYFFAVNRYMQTGWLHNSGSWYYLNPVSDGTKGRLMTGWQKIGGKWYCFEPEAGKNQGRMYANERTPDGYFVGADGAWDGRPAVRSTGR